MSGAASAFDPYLFRVARFTLWQAALSTVLSIVPAIFVARALSRHPDFPGRRLILRLFALPLALPAIVAALGILALFGRAGYFAGSISVAFDSTWPGIYGLSGILVAHVFFNLPLATRLFLETLDTLPADQWRLASQLGMGAGPSFRLIEWPAIRAALPGVAGLVFMLCITSFTIILTLGGGPAATTLEVAIYQALRFDFDPARAVTLTVLQIALTAIVMIVLTRLGANTALDANLPVAPRRFIGVGRAEAALNAALVLAALLFVAGPMLATVTGGAAGRSRPPRGRCSGAQSDSDQPRAGHPVGAPVGGAGAVAGGGAAGAGAAAEIGKGDVARARRRHAAPASFWSSRRSSSAPAGSCCCAIRTCSSPPRRSWSSRSTRSWRCLSPSAPIRPAHDAAGERNDRLCAQLGLAGWNRLRLIDWPVLRRPLMTGFAFAMALSLGDLGVIALFGSDSVQTLPYLLLGRMGSYRTDDAAGLALLLGLLCLALVFLADRFGKEAAP